MTVEEMTTTLSRLGIEVLESRGDEIQAHCPAHVERTGHEDRNPSWWINADSGAHNCFSCGWKGNLYTLISYVGNVDMAQVNDWLGSSANLSARFERLIKPKEQKPIEDVTRVTESMMSAFTHVPEDAARSRGLLVETSTIYGLRWDARNGNWIIPIREPLTNKLLGWQEKGHTQRYFNNKPVRVPKSGSLFGYDQYQGGDMIVVESPLDVVRLASVGVTGGVAAYGASISTAQFNLIRGADRIIFAMDNDEAGRASSNELLKLCRDMGVESWFFNYDNTDRKDVGGMSRDEIRWGLENARHMVQGKKAVR